MKKPGMYLYIIFFWVVIVSVGFVSIRASHDFKTTAREQSLVNGALSSSFEKYYNDTLPIRNFAVNFWGAINFALFNEGRQGVVIGDNGVLFTDEEFYEPANSAEVLRQNIKKIVALKSEAEAHSIPICVVLLPAKADIYDSWLAAKKPSRFMNGMYRSVADQLRAEGVQLVDLRPTFKQHSQQTQLYIKNDTHWTPAGADLAAQVISASTRKYLASDSSKRYVTTVVSHEVHTGDLLNYLPLEPYFASLLPKKEMLEIRKTQLVEQEEEAGLGLFGDAEAGVALVGTSYSADERWNFAGALKQHLSADVYNYASRGEGPYKPMQEYFKTNDWIDHPPELVIWEVPVRYLMASESS